MQQMCKLALAGAFAVWMGLAQAGTQTLGFEIGTTTVEQVRSSLPKPAKVEDLGTSPYSGGPVLQTGGESYDIEALTKVLYVFDEQRKLAGVVMTMGKHRIDAVEQALNKKYKPSAQQRPFVGNQYIRYNTPDTVIEVDAPHMSFDMTVSYLRNDLMKRFKEMSAAQDQVKKQREAAKF